MKVINLFPLTEKSVETPLHTGPVYFTCPHCKTEVEIRFSKAVFRSVEFDCAKCGVPFRISNPTMIDKSKDKPKVGK